MHNYHDHITPSPFGPYPRKPTTQKSEPSQSVKPEQNGDKKQESPVKKAKQGPRIMTVVLHPTPRTRQQEMIILANRPAPDARAKTKGSMSRDGLTPTSAQPPQTPLSAVPSTPLTSTSRGLPNKRQKMLLEEKDYYNFEAELLITTEPPLLLDPARNPEEAVKALNLLSHPLHSEPAPSPKTRKRTHAEMAADDAQAAEEERRLLIMDERVKPSMRAGAGMAAAEGQTTSSALGFSRFKTLETIKQRHEENDRRKKEEEARQAMEKRNHDAALAKRKMLEERQRAEHLAIQKQQQMLKQQQLMQNHQQQQAQVHAQNMAHNPNSMPTNPQQQQLQQASLAQHSSPIVRNQTPMMASSPLMQNAASVSAMGGFPMQSTASNQGAGSPPRPPSAAMQHANVAMARQMSQSQQAQSRHATPQMAQNTPRMATSGVADPHRQISATPQMQHRSPMAGMQATPQPMMNGTPQMNQMNQMNQQHLTPGQQMALMNRNRMQGSPQNMTPEQVAMMRNQQQLAIQQGLNPQNYAAQLQRMQQMSNMQSANGSPMQQQMSQQGQMHQLAANDPQLLQRQQQLRAQQMVTNQRLMQQMAANGQIPPQRYQQMLTQQRNLQAQQAAAMRANQSLGDPSNTDQYMQNLRQQQALLAQMQRRNQQGNAMQQQQQTNGMQNNMMQPGQQGGAQNIQQMNMMQQQQMLQNARNQGGQDLAQQFAAMQNALNRPGTGGM